MVTTASGHSPHVTQTGAQRGLVPGIGGQRQVRDDAGMGVCRPSQDVSGTVGRSIVHHQRADVDGGAHFAAQREKGVHEVGEHRRFVERGRHDKQVDHRRSATMYMMS